MAILKIFDLYPGMILGSAKERKNSILKKDFLYLPPVYLARRESNISSLFVCPPDGGGGAHNPLVLSGGTGVIPWSCLWFCPWGGGGYVQGGRETYRPVQVHGRRGYQFRSRGKEAGPGQDYGVPSRHDKGIPQTGLTQLVTNFNGQEISEVSLVLCTTTFWTLIISRINCV